MAVEERLFLGIKQVTKETFSALDDSEKVGYLWFVRNEDPEHFEIYLGTRMYGETNETLEQLLREINELFDITSEHQECLESMNVISDEFIHSLFLGRLRQLVINVIGGEVLSKTGEGEYRSGTVVRIGVEPEDGYSLMEILTNIEES